MFSNLTGDINGDSIVHMKDGSIVARALQSKIPCPGETLHRSVRARVGGSEIGNISVSGIATIFVLDALFRVCQALTSLKRQLDDMVMKLVFIRDKLQGCSEFPPCCLTFYRDGRVRCDSLGPMPEKEFLLRCSECKKKMSEKLAGVFSFLT